MKMKRVALVIGMFASLALAQAESEFTLFDGVGAHGGNIVVCPSQPPVTLDYYHAALPTFGGPVKLIDLENWSEKQVIAYFRALFKDMPALEQFDSAMKTLGPVESWIATSLKSVDDSGEPYILPPNCQRVTAAVRQDQTMYVDPEVYNGLSAAQKGLLRVHEALYFASSQSNSKDVRELARVALRDGFKRADLERVIRGLSMNVYWFETLTSVNYFVPTLPKPEKYFCDLSIWSQVSKLRYWSYEEPQCISAGSGNSERDVRGSCITDKGCRFENGCVLDVLDRGNKISMLCPWDKQPVFYKKERE